MPAFLLRVPDHLGDGVMAIPAVQSIATLGAVRIVGPSWAERLYGDLPSCGEAPETAAETSGATLVSQGSGADFGASVAKACICHASLSVSGLSQPT